jgi:hypothetical protein
MLVLQKVICPRNRGEKAFNQETRLTKSYFAQARRFAYALRKKTAVSGEFDHADIEALSAQSFNQRCEMLVIARFALDFGRQAFGGQMGEYPLVDDLDDVDVMFKEHFGHAQQ